MKTVGKVISEAITPLVDSFNKWFDSMGGAEGVLKKVKQVIQDVTPYVPIIAGAIIGGLVPAFLALAASIIATVAPLIPFMALGALLVLAWEKNKLVFYMLAAAVTIAGIALAVAFVPPMLASTIATLGLIASVLLAAAPFIIIGAIIAGAAYLIITNWDKITKFVTDVVSNIVAQFQALPAFIGMILGQIGQFISGIYNTITTWLSDTWNSIVRFSVDAFNAFMKWLWDLPGNIAYWFGFAVGFILKTLLELPGQINAASLAILVFFGNLLLGIYNTVVGWITSAVTWLITELLALPGQIHDAEVAIITFFINMAVGIYNTLVNWISSAVNTVVDFLTKLPGRIVEFAAKFLKSAGDTGNNIFNGLRDAVKGIPDMLSGILTDMVKKVTDFAGKAFDAAKNMGGKLWDGFKKGMGISSPSYIERALTAISEQGFSTIDDMKTHIGQLNDFASTAKSIVGGLSPMAFSASLAPVSVGATPSAVGSVGNVVHVDLSGANITSPQVAEEYAEAIGDKIIERLSKTIRI
jgi:phage-related protein